MTVSEQQTRPPDNPPPPEHPEWMPYPGAGHYEFSHRGKARSVDRTIDGKFHPAKEPLSTRLNKPPLPSGELDPTAYVLVDIRLDTGEKKTVSMQKGVLRSHDRDPKPGEECRHGPGGPQDNRWPENIQWGSRPANLADMAAARPQRPPKECNRCGAQHRARGLSCDDCMDKLGMAAAGQLASGMMLDRVSTALGYPPAGVYRLAVTRGGLQVSVGHAAVTPSDPAPVTLRHRQPLTRRLRSVITGARASRQNSDAQ